MIENAWRRADRASQLGVLGGQWVGYLYTTRHLTLTNRLLVVLELVSRLL
jgi:hypothetical protein